MQDLKKDVSLDSENKKSFLSLSKMCKYLKKYFLPWIITSAVAAVLIGGTYTISSLTNRTISTTVNFSFDGVEAGLDPFGNKFDVNEIKSKSAVKEVVNELGIEDADIDSICSSITISGNVPDNIIERITKYNSMYSSDGAENIATIKNMQDTTYYPTQYSINMDCEKTNLTYNECVDVLNNITERYKQTFSEKYGYKKSFANAVFSFDYNDYDYIDAVDVFDSSLDSLYSYITDFAEKDSSRFKSEQTGYTFSDLAESIDTIRSENLDMIYAYISLYNMTKDKENLIVNYEFKIEECERQKKINEDTLEALESTLDVYEKNSILIFSQATSGADATINQSSDTYDNLIEQVVDTEKRISEYQQQIDKYNKRIDSLQKSNKKGSDEKINEYFTDLNEKVAKLLETTETTVCEYYEDTVYVNAYEILSLVSSSTFGTIANAIKDSFDMLLPVEMIILAFFIVVCALEAKDKNVTLVFKKLMNKKGLKKNRSKGGRK